MKVTIEDIRNDANGTTLLYKAIRGSHAFGLATETSDIDEIWVYMAPIKDYLDLREDYQPTIENESHDIVIYEIEKFLELLNKSNPNVLEAMFIPDDCVKFVHPLFQPLLDMREKFLTKMAFKPYVGYARNQISKARGLNKAIVKPPVEKRRPILDFCYVEHELGSTKLLNWLDNRGLSSRYCGASNIPNMYYMHGIAYDWGQMFRDYEITVEHLKTFVENNRKEYITMFMKDVASKCDSVRDAMLMWEDLKLSEYWDSRTKNDVKDILETYMKNLCINYKFSKEDVITMDKLKEKYIRLSKMVPFILEHYRIDVPLSECICYWYETHKDVIGYRGLTNEDETSNELRLSSIKKGDRFIIRTSYNKEDYSAHCRDYKNYQEWKKNRNPERFKTNTEHGKNYDSKNMYSCCRIMLTAAELAKTGVFRLRRPDDRDFLLSVKKGELSYDEIIKFADNLNNEMIESMKTSGLPESVDSLIINDYLFNLRLSQIQNYLQNEKSSYNSRPAE